MFLCPPPEWGQHVEPAFGCTGTFPMGKNQGAEGQTCRCRSRRCPGSSSSPVKVRYPVLASSGARLCALPGVLCGSGLKHAGPPGSQETFCQ